MSTSATIEILLGALREDIRALSAKVVAMDSRQREEIREKERRREMLRFRLLLVYIAIVWSFWIVTLLCG